MIQIGNNKIKGAFLGKDELKYIYIGKTCVYYKETPSTQGINVCFAVVDNINSYKDRIYDTVYDKGTKSWYFINDVDEYEKYGVIDEVSTLDKPTKVANSKSCSVNLTSHGSWITSTTNPDSSTYDAYMSDGSHNVGNGYDIMVITLSTGFTEFDVYIRSYAESYYDYTVIGSLDSPVPTTNTDNNGSNVKDSTIGRGSQTSSTDLSGYKKVSYTGIDSTKTHTIWVEFRKDGSVNANDDRGYVLIPKVPAYTIQGTTTYDGKLVALSTDKHEYKYTNGSWVDQGEITTTGNHKYYAKSNDSSVLKFRGLKSPWNNGYKVVLDVNKKAEEGFSIYPAFEDSAPLEFQEYGGYYYFDWHDPTSTTANTCDISDYSRRVWGDISYNDITKNPQILLSIDYSVIKVTSLADGSSLYFKDFERTESMSYCTTGDYEWLLQINKGATVHSVSFYDNNNNIIRNYAFNGTNFVDSITLNEANLAQGTVTSEDLGEYSVNYPTSYENLSAPVNNLKFNSLAEANAYTGCCYYGMVCTIDENNYFLTNINGKATWVKSVLPSAYTKMDYLIAPDFTSLYATVNRYLDLGLKFNTKYKFEMICQANASSRDLYYRFFATNQKIDSSNELTTQWHVSEKELHIGMGETGYNVTGSWANKNTLVWDQGTFSVNGTNAFTDTQSFTTTSNLCLLGCPNVTGQEAFAGKLYSFKLWDTDGTPLRNLIPCQRKSDSIYGMYDTVNDVFYSSANSNYPFSGATA